MLLFLIFSSFLLLLSLLISKRVNDYFNPYSLIVSIWCIFLLGSICFGDYFGFYKINSYSILIIFIFLFIVGIIVYIIIVSSNVRSIPEYNININILKFFTIFFFILFIIGNIIYFYNLNNLLGIKQIINNPWIYKNAVITGTIQEDSLIYFGRNFAFTGTLLSLFCIKSKNKSSYFLLLIYLVITFLNIRREPILIKISFVITPFLLIYKKNFLKIGISILIFIIVFVLFFTFTIRLLNFNQIDILRALFTYTSGAFNSFQYILDNGYSISSDLPLNYSFYWVYSILKYIIPNISPVDVILLTQNQSTTNIFTGLSFIVVDSNNSKLYLFLYLVIYSIYVGIIIGYTTSFAHKKINFLSLILYSTIISLSIRSYMNPTFSYLDFLFSVFYGIILHFVSKLNIMKSISCRICMHQSIF